MAKEKITYNGKFYSVDKKQIENLMTSLDISKEEAIETYLADEGIVENEEQNALDEIASENYKKIVKKEGAKAKKPKKSRKVKVSEEKQDISNKILQLLQENYGNVEILTKNKLFSVKIGEKILKVNIIEQRPPKN